MSSNTVNQRANFASTKNPLEYPDFLEVQLKSFQDFLQLDTPPEKRKKEGLYKVFAENFPIADTRNNFVLEFLDYYIDPPRYTIDDCIERGLTYSVPLKAKLKLYCTDPDHEDFDTVIQDVFLGPIPYMTDKATFVINGAERVVVSQLHRSPGVFFGQSVHANGTKLYSARIIPFKGSWIEFATDINNVMYAYIDRKKKLPVTTLLRAIGFENDKDILEIFNLAEDVKVNKTNLKKVVGRKLAARVLKTWIEDFVDEDTGEVVSIERNEVIIDRETVIEPEHIDEIIDSGVQNILILCKPGQIKPHSKFKAEVYILKKEEGGRHTPFHNKYRPQFYLRTMDCTGEITLPEGTEMVMPGDNVTITVELIYPVALNIGLRFAIREGGRTVGAGQITEIID